MADQKIEHAQVWLHSLAVMLEPWFTNRGYQLPRRVRLYVGNERTKALGRAHLTRTKDGWQNVFVHARIDDPIETAVTVVHELVHCALPKGTGHGPEFAKMADALGLLPPWKETPPGPELKAHLERLIAALGPYPHTAMPWAARLPRGPALHGYVARCAGCRSVVRMRPKTFERGVLIICNNIECELLGEEMEIEEEVPSPPRPRRKPADIARN